MRQGSPPIIQLRRRYRRCDHSGVVPTQRPLTVQLPGELAEALRNYALVTNTPVNQVINAALAEYLEANAADVVHAALDKGHQQHAEAFNRLGNLWLRC